VQTALQALRADTDPNIRAEAEQALNSLVLSTPPGAGTAVR
jgi:hypothetical protein